MTILPTDAFIASALVRQGVIPCSPVSPSVAITIDALEFYRVSYLRNHHCSIQAFVKTLCDLHMVSCRATQDKVISPPSRYSFDDTSRASFQSLSTFTFRFVPRWISKFRWPFNAIRLIGDSNTLARHALTNSRMNNHSYSKCYIHLMGTTP
jgi:hypothetical protein